MRRILLCCCSVVAITAVMAPVGAAPPVIEDHVDGYSIIPPGQSGEFTNPHRNDQLDMYAGLIESPDDLTGADLGNLFHEFEFEPEVVESEVTPRPGVTIYYDGFGIPHVYGDSDAGAAFGLGYATAKDRLWHADILRRAATGRLSEFLGSDTFEFDKEIRRDTYTTDELQKMYNKLDNRFGASGAAVQSMLVDYVNGINQWIGEIEDGTHTKPGEYVVQGVPVEEWSVTDVVALSVFQLRQFGESAGGELRNAALWQELRRMHGKKLGKKIFKDLNVRNDPDAYPTVPPEEGPFPSQDLGPIDPDSRAIPDDARRVWNKLINAESTQQEVLKAVNAETPASHFIAIAPEGSASNNSLQWGGPQVGFSVPQFFMEIAVHSPNLDFRGPALPGAALLSPIGRGRDFAWSLTSGVSDAVDTRVEKLCSRSGGDVTKQTNSYKYKGDCERMKRRTEMIHVRKANGNLEAHQVKIYRTVHGPVVVRATVDDAPVAIVRERNFWKHETDTVPAIYDMNSNQMDSLAEFQAALSEWTVSFNVVYADQDTIAYFHAGKYPLRQEGVDTMLPVWGTGKWEWRGDVPVDDLPRMIDPAQGWIANWNNKPSTGWDNGDSSQWGPTQRVRLMTQGIEATLAAGDADLADVVNVIKTAATQDGRANFIGQEMAARASEATGVEADARSLVEAWIEGGAHRTDRDGNNLQDNGPAVAIFDTWYDKLVHRVFDDELGDLYDVAAAKISDDPRFGNGSAFYADFSNYLWRLFDPDRRNEMARNYCNDMDTPDRERCRDQVTAALSDAVAELSASQGDDPSAWTWEADYIEFDEVGAISVDPIPWQNRGTYNHAVEVTGTVAP